MALFSGLQVRCTSAAVPERTEGVDDWLSRFDERQVLKVREATGIEKIRVAGPHTSTLDLATAASMPTAQWAANASINVEALVVATQTPPQAAPGMAHLLAHRLGLGNNLFCVDINHGCSAYPYVMAVAGSLISSGAVGSALVVVGDTITNFTDPQDHRTRMVFGDAAAATLVTTGGDSWGFGSGADGSCAGALSLGSSTPGTPDNWLHMDGLAVMNFTLLRVPRLMDELRRIEADVTGQESFDTVVLHQANRFIVRTLSGKVGREGERYLHGYSQYGNTGPASIPLALATADVEPQELGRTAMLGFGIGLSWAGLTADLSQIEILPITELSGGSSG